MRVNLAVLSGCCVAALAMQAHALPLILTWSDAGTDVAITNGVTTQRENDKGGVIVPFGEDAFAFTDRNHQWNGTRYNSAGTLSTTVAAGDTVVPIPSYLVGGEYMSTLNTNRDNAAYRMNVTVGADPVIAYLLIDNRVGDGTATNKPTLGSGGTGIMPWVADDGWTTVSTGLFPGGQPDYVGFDEGVTITDFNARATTPDSLGTGAGNNVNNHATIYSKTFLPGSVITLKEQNDGTSRDMYGMVVTAIPVPEPGSLMALAGAAVLGLMRRRRR